MIELDIKSILRNQQVLIKDLELKKNYEEMVVKIDQIIVSLNKYKKSIEDPHVHNTINILIKSYENKKSNVQYFSYINKYKRKISSKIFQIYKDQIKNKNETNKIDVSPQKFIAPNNPTNYTLSEFEIVDHTNIQDMIKAIITLCESSLIEIYSEKNLTLNYTTYIEELKKIKVFMNSILNEGLLVNSNIENYQSKVKEVMEKIQKYKKKSHEIAHYLHKKGYNLEKNKNKKNN
jgi:hypothetical protein